MKLYSDFGPRRTRQVIADVVSLVFIAGWVWFGATLYGLVSGLAEFGRGMKDAGAKFRETMTEAGDALGDILLIGPAIRAPFREASSAGALLEQAGRDQQHLVQQLALALGAGAAVLPILMILVLWLVPRIRFVRRAANARALLRAGAGLDLLALRALAGQKITTIAKIDADAMGAWRRRDEVVMRKLAALELKSSGVRVGA